jgi:nicotinamidase-related amidase
MSSIAATASRRAVGKLRPDQTALLVCDIQERFRPVIHRMETVINTTKFMTSVAREMGVPIVVTQQYTKVFGPTITDAFADPSILGTTSAPIFEKKKFSMLTDECASHLDTLGRTSFVLVGIEAHVCVQETVLDLLELGHDVHVVCDGVSSQRPYDREVALRRMEAGGAWLTTAQSAAFALLGGADHPNFKAVSGLVKEHMTLRNEFEG